MFKQLSKPLLFSLFAAASVVYIFGLYIDVMEIDAAQYASLSHEMLASKNYLMLYFRHGNYLDKPPLCFWLEVISYKVFGINNFSYKLPSFLFTLLGLLATFKLAEKLYDKGIALLATLMLFTCQAYFLFNHDVRTDTILAGAVIFAIWQLYEYIERRNVLNFILGFTGIAAAMMTKGPLGLMVPVIALLAHLLYNKRWKELFRIEWLLGIALVLLLLFPMMLGLYKQYGNEGLRFYFWTQSFGRITGESQWRSDTDALFFVHTFIWAFLPWAFLTLYGIVTKIIALFKEQSRKKIVELMTLVGMVLTFFALSLSKYKLPHYIFVTFPLVAILTASTATTLIEQNHRWTKIFKQFHRFEIIVLWILLYTLFLAFPCNSFAILTVIIALQALSLYVAFAIRSNWASIIIAPAITIIAVNFMFNTHLYPTLLKYQAGKEMAKAATEKNRSVYTFNAMNFSFDFYAKKVVTEANDDTLHSIIKNKKPVYVLLDEDGMKHFIAKNIPTTTIKMFYDYPVTVLTYKFLNPKTRFSAFRKSYLVTMN